MKRADHPQALWQVHIHLFIYYDLVIVQIIKITERDGPISRPEQKQTTFKTIKHHLKSFMTTSNISSDFQFDVNTQKHLIRRVFNKYKYGGRVHDSCLGQLVKELAKSDLVPPELAFKSPHLKISVITL